MTPPNVVDADLSTARLSGPQRELPDRRIHQLFEDQVRRRPAALAAVHGDHRLSYRELNSRANRLARFLLAAGVQREDPVAVIAHRNLDWLAAVLAIFKAGAAYLPVEPHFPAERVRAMITRAGCRLVLTEPTITAALAVNIDDQDLDLEIEGEALAYIFFTSGSTGEPKGAMCEHAGMINHLYAKIDDLEIGAGQVVAQTAPQCFDISLWQLFSALLVGGSTLIVDQTDILDVPRFVRAITQQRANVLQLVPSYLDTVLGYLERHRHPLPDLRRVSVTGEALPPQLVRRWFAVIPHVPLINAYGLTETSDDTNHEILYAAPEDDRILVGHLINNVSAAIVDDVLQPVPAGEAGEIIFSGVCVGRGYINDPERTNAAFLPDPNHPGQRLYRSGDLGRWLPDGRLEFLGRRDAQVKIRGFRIEIDEIESRLAAVPGVDRVAVVVVDEPSRQLVACYTGSAEADDLADRLASTIPDYMIPSLFHRLLALPLTDNGKTDRKALVGLTSRLRARHGNDPPRTAIERRVADAWAEALGIGVDQVGRNDSFFDRGGTSLSAVKLAIALDRAVTIRDIKTHPHLVDLARLCEGKLT
jgi:amino acid adenylation domain-containing protein